MKPIALFALLLISCGSKPVETTEESNKPELPKQTVIGRIASVSKAGKFVLIQKYGPGLLPPNHIYQARGPDGRSASLRPSGERVRDFFAADLLNGTVKIGDAVITYSQPAKTENSDQESLDSDENDPDSDDPTPQKKSLATNQDSKNTEE